MQCFSTTSSLPIPIPAAERESEYSPSAERESEYSLSASVSVAAAVAAAVAGRDVRVAAVALLTCPDADDDGCGCHKNGCQNKNATLAPFPHLEQVFCLLEPRPFSSCRSTKGLVSRRQKTCSRFAKGARVLHSSLDLPKRN